MLTGGTGVRAWLTLDAGVDVFATRQVFGGGDGVRPKVVRVYRRVLRVCVCVCVRSEMTHRK